MSSHADQSQILNWLSGLQQAPTKIFINHGEPKASDALRVKVKDTYGYEVRIPYLGEEFQL